MASAQRGEALPLSGGGSDSAALLDDKLDVQLRHGFVRKVFAIVG